MHCDVILPQVKSLIDSSRLFDTLLHYLFSLMLSADKHTQANAEKFSGKDNTLFSNLLKADTSISKIALNRAAKRKLVKLSQKRRPIEEGAPWTVAIIVDATLHERSSRHMDNSQRFNHGQGWVIGHQWTNVGFLIANQFIPLPPIAFYTRKECKGKGIEYKTEHDRVSEYLRTLGLNNLGLNINPAEIVVLMDSGYDCKEIQNTILSRGWSFVVSLKCTRTISPIPMEWSRVDEYFSDGRRPWKSIRIESYRGKRKKLRQYNYKQRVGFLKGVRRQVKLVCSQRSHETRMKFLSCSNIHVAPKLILLCYRKRWVVEIFHREIKGYLGLEDAGVRKFASLQNHVHWVYVAYILLKEKFPESGIKQAQILLERDARKKELKKSLQLLSRIKGEDQLKKQLLSVLERVENSMAA